MKVLAIFNKRLYVLSFFLFLVVFAHVSGIAQVFSFEALKLKRDFLQGFVQENYMLAVMIYIILYTIIVSLFLPIAAILTIVGGFLFGVLNGALYASLGATCGSVCNYLFIRYALGDSLQAKYQGQLQDFNMKIKSQGTFYLVFIHFVSVIPLFLINTLVALTRVPLGTFIWTTMLGIMPTVLVFAFAGQQFNYANSYKDIVSGSIVTVLVCIACLGVVPMLVKSYTSRS